MASKWPARRNEGENDETSIITYLPAQDSNDDIYERAYAKSRENTTRKEIAPPVQDCRNFKNATFQSQSQRFFLFFLEFISHRMQKSPSSRRK